MQYRVLGRTGVNVSPLCLGSDNFGDATPADEATAIIKRALDAGINLIDTGDVYAEGMSETIIGKTLKERGIRDQVVLPTGQRGGDVVGGDPWIERDLLRPVFERDADGLPRYRLAYIEVARGHWKTGGAGAVAVAEAVLHDSTDVVVCAGDRDQAAHSGTLGGTLGGGERPPRAAFQAAEEA